MNQGELYEILKKHKGNKFTVKMIKELFPNKASCNTGNQLTAIARYDRYCHSDYILVDGKRSKVFWYDGIEKESPF